MSRKLTFLKLGGSLITDKSKPAKALNKKIDALANEIVSGHEASPGSGLLIGHGSGSFGHVPARKYATRKGVHSEADWLGFAEVWKQANALNQIVMKALLDAQLPVIAFPPSASVISKRGKIQHWDLAPLEMALEAGLIPVVYGDVVFDSEQGGSILSTEELFLHLCGQLNVTRILLAANEPVYADYPSRNKIVERVNAKSHTELKAHLGNSEEVSDVTGGMKSKVGLALQMVAAKAELEVRIFSGTEDGELRSVLQGKKAGTLIQQG